MDSSVLVFSVLYVTTLIAFSALSTAGMWLIFEKSGQPGWHSLIPIFNVVVFFKISGYDWWWAIIPLANSIFMIMAYNRISSAFGHGIGHTLGLIFLTPFFMAAIGFGGAQYVPDWETHHPVSPYA